MGNAGKIHRRRGGAHRSGGMSDGNPPTKGRWRLVLLVIYYTAILAGVLYLHGRGGLDTPKFIYQGF
jgi:hypothetical protein